MYAYIISCAHTLFLCIHCVHLVFALMYISVAFFYSSGRLGPNVLGGAGEIHCIVILLLHLLVSSAHTFMCC